VDARHWLEQLRGELAQQKLPPFYVERLVVELTDHLQDFQEDRMSTDARDLHGMFHSLGSPGEIAAAARDEFRKQRFCLRHPVVTFGVLPVFTLLLFWVGAIVAMVAGSEIIKWIGGESIGEMPGFAAFGMPVLALGIVTLPIMAATMWFCRIARRSHVSWKWQVLACSLIALLAFSVFGDVLVPGANRSLLHAKTIRITDPIPEQAEKYHLSFGFEVGKHPTALQLVQLLIPMLILGGALWRQSHEGPAIGKGTLA